MLKTLNFVEVKSALNLGSEESYMIDDRESFEIGQMEIDEKDLEAARRVLAEAIQDKKRLDEAQVNSPKTFNGIDWDNLAYLIEVQLFMDKVMHRIEWIDTRLEAAKAGNYLPREQFLALVGEKKALWSKWNKGKALSSEVVGEEKALWGKFFSIEDREEFLARHLDMDVSIWNTFGRDDEEDESFDKFHLDVMDMLAEAHVLEMKEYDREVDVDFSFQDKRMNARLENEALNNASQDEMLF